MANVIEYSGSDKWKQKATDILNRGGGGGTDDYEELNNLPQINSVTLLGNKTLAELGIVEFGDRYEIRDDRFWLYSGNKANATAQNPIYGVCFVYDGSNVALRFAKYTSPTTATVKSFYYDDMERISRWLQDDGFDFYPIGGHSGGEIEYVNTLFLESPVDIQDLSQGIYRMMYSYDYIGLDKIVNNVSTGIYRIDLQKLSGFKDYYRIDEDYFMLFSGNKQSATAQNPVYGVGFDGYMFIMQKWTDASTYEMQYLNYDGFHKLIRWVLDNGRDIYPNWFYDYTRNKDSMEIVMEVPIDVNDPTLGRYIMSYGMDEIHLERNVSGTVTSLISIDLNNLNGLTGNVQTQIDSINSSLANIFDLVYPVGSIYMSTDSANPSTKFGGTWVAWGSGKVPVGVDTNDTSFNTVEATGGSKSQSYTPAGSNAAVTLTAAQSGVPAHSHGLNSHKHKYDKTNTPIEGTAITVDQMPSHSHGGKTGSGNSMTYRTVWDAGSSTAANHTTGWGGGIGYADYTNANWPMASHTHNITAQGGGKAHAHTLKYTSTDSGAASGSTANNTAANASSSHNHTFTGTAATISNLQPYITCYMWKRTA